MTDDTQPTPDALNAALIGVSNWVASQVTTSDAPTYLSGAQASAWVLGVMHAQATVATLVRSAAANSDGGLR